MKYFIPTHKTCKRCGIDKPISCYKPIQAPYYRSICTECINKSKRDFYATPEGKLKRQSYSAKYYYRPGVKERQKAYAKKYYELNKARVIARGQAYNLKSKNRAVEYKGGKCSCCGYDKCLAALEFHHVDPKTKSGNSTFWLKWPWHKARSELDACVLVCSNCHREIHAGLRILNKKVYSFGMRPVLGYKKRSPLIVHKRNRPWAKLVTRK